MTSPKHATLSASSAARWIACPGSIALCVGLSSPLTEYAERGTANHKLAEACLMQMTDQHTSKSAELYIGKSSYISKIDKQPIMVREEDAIAVQVYLDTIDADCMSTPSSTLTVEKRFNLDWLYHGLFGTNDAMLTQPYGILRVYDYKNGSGVAVDAEMNAQAMYYALGAIGADNLEAVEQVEIIIVQPNGQGEKVKRWMTTPEALYKWAAEVLLPAAKATEAVNAPLHAGDHCKFCPANDRCPERIRSLAAVAGLTFDEIPEGKVELPNVQLIPVEKLGQIVEFGKQLRSWFASAEESLHNHLLQGHLVTGWKLVEGRASRKWVDEAVVAATLLPVYGDSIYEPKSLRSVTQMEKAIKLGNGNVKVLDGLVEVSRAPQIAPEDDKRPAINATASFEVIDELEEYLD